MTQETPTSCLERLIDAANGVLFLFPARDYPDSTIGGRALADLEAAIVEAGGSVRRPRQEAVPEPCEHAWGEWRRVDSPGSNQRLGQARDCERCKATQFEDWVEDVSVIYEQGACPIGPAPAPVPSLDDPLYSKAEMIVKAASPRICVANLQRTLCIGYNRAQKLMESLVANGVVESFDTGKGGTGYRLVIKG